MTKKIINPLKIKKEDLPLIVLSSDSQDFIGWAIRARTRGEYNHSMIMTIPEKCASQSWVFKEIPILNYMKKGCKLKFWKFKNISVVQKKLICGSVYFDLKRPWWERRYDFLGVFGQLIGIKRINNPFRYYCSEKTSVYIRKIIDNFPIHPSPDEQNKIFKENPDMEVYGYWFYD